MRTKIMPKRSAAEADVGRAEDAVLEALREWWAQECTDGERLFVKRPEALIGFDGQGTPGFRMTPAEVEWCRSAFKKNWKSLAARAQREIAPLDPLDPQD